GPLDFSKDPKPTLQHRQYEQIASLGGLPGPRKRPKPRQDNPDGRKSAGQPGTRSGKKLTQDQLNLEWARAKAYWDRYWAPMDRNANAFRDSQMTKDPEPGMNAQEEQAAFDSCATRAFRTFRKEYGMQGLKAAGAGVLIGVGGVVFLEGIPFVAGTELGIR